MYKRKKLKNKKFARGGRTDVESQYGAGSIGSYSYADDQNRSDNQTAQSIKDTGIKSDTATSTAIGIIGKTVFDVSGAGLVYGAAKKAGPKLKQAVTPKIAKDTAEARLSGSPIYKFSTPRPVTPTLGGDNDAVTQPLKKILKKPIESDTTQVASFRPKDFFPFQAYKSGGVSSGPPPLKGPNPQVPPVKFRKGKMTKTYKFSCPSRPDGIRGMGAAIKGHKFIGVK